MICKYKSQAHLTVYRNFHNNFHLNIQYKLYIYIQSIIYGIYVIFSAIPIEFRFAYSNEYANV